MSKFLLNLPLQITKVFINSKIQFFIQKSFFPCFRPGQPCGPFGLWPSQPAHRPRRPPQAKIAPAGPSSLCVGRVFAENTFSLSDHAFPSWAPLPRLSVNWAPSVRCVFPTTQADPDRFLLSPPATPRRPTSDLVMPANTITPRLDSPP
jgi:hypothetical protein